MSVCGWSSVVPLVLSCMVFLTEKVAHGRGVGKKHWRALLASLKKTGTFYFDGT
jgi:hypothetical protein